MWSTRTSATRARNTSNFQLPRASNTAWQLEIGSWELNLPAAARLQAGSKPLAAIPLRPIPAPCHLRPDEREHPSDSVVERPFGHVAAHNRPRRHVLRLPLQLADLVVELRLCLA